MANDWFTIGAVAITAVGAWATAKLANRAQERKTKADQEVGAGQLALNIATKLQDDLDRANQRIGNHQAHTARQFRRIRQAWAKHLVWDDALLDMVEEVDPGAIARMPERPEMPLDEIEDMEPNAHV